MRPVFKVAFSLLITVVIFSIFVVFAFSGLFDLIETRFYNQRITSELVSEVQRTRDALLEYHEHNRTVFSSILSSEHVKRSFLPNQSREDIFQRETIFNNVKADFPNLLYVRFVDPKGNIHYSTFEEDIKSRNNFNIVYNRIEDVDTSIPNEELLLSENEEDNYIIDAEEGRLIYQFPFYDHLDIFKGTALFYLSEKDVKNFLIKNAILEKGISFSLVHRLGYMFNIDIERYGTVEEEIQRTWDESSRFSEVRNEPLISSETEKRFFLFSTFKDRLGYVGLLVPEDLFTLNTYLKNILMVSFFLTIFLILFLILSIRQDRVLVLSERIKRFQINFLKEYVENKDTIDWERWKREIGNKKRVVSDEIKSGLGKLNREKENEVDALIDKSWDEILSIIGEKYEAKPAETVTLPNQVEIKNLEQTLERILKSGNFSIPVTTVQQQEQVTTTRPVPSSTDVSSRESGARQKTEQYEEIPFSREPGEAVEAEEIEELGEMEEVEEASEPSQDVPTAGQPVEVEEVSEVEGETEEIEELGEMEEVEEASEPSQDVPTAGQPVDVEEVSEVEGETEEIGELGEMEEVEEASEPSQDVPTAGQPVEVEEIPIEDIEEIPSIEPADIEQPEELEDEEIPGEEETAEPEPTTEEEGEEIEEEEEGQDVEEVSEPEPEIEEEGEDVEELPESEARHLQPQPTGENEPAEGVFETPEPAVAENEELEPVEELEEVEELSTVEEVLEAEVPVPAAKIRFSPLPIEQQEPLDELELIDEQLADTRVETLEMVSGGYNAYSMFYSGASYGSGGVNWKAGHQVDDEPEEVENIEEENQMDRSGLSQGDSGHKKNVEKIGEIPESSTIGSSDPDFLDSLEQNQEEEFLEEVELLESEETLEEAEPLESERAELSEPTELSEESDLTEAGETAEKEEDSNEIDQFDRIIATLQKNDRLQLCDLEELSAMFGVRRDGVITSDIDGVPTIAEDVFKMKGNAGDEDFKKLADDLTDRREDTETGTFTIADLIAGESVDLSWEDEEQIGEHTSHGAIHAPKRRECVTEDGFNFDMVAAPFAGSSMQIIKTLLNLSRETGAIYAALFRHHEGRLSIDQSVGLDSRSIQSFSLFSGEAFYDRLLKEKKTVLLKVPMRVFDQLAGKLSVTDEKFLQTSFFIPVFYHDSRGYLFFGLKSSDVSIEIICEQLSDFCK